MGGLIQPTPATEERDSSRKIIALAVTLVMVIAVMLALLLRSEPRTAGPPPAYAAKLLLSDLKMSAAENFVGATVSYIDGTVTNTGDKTVTSATAEVFFKDELGQTAQREVVTLRALKTEGPYPEAVDLSKSPLLPGQSTPFRMTFETISAQWNRQYPEVRVIDVSLK